MEEKKMKEEVEWEECEIMEEKEIFIKKVELIRKFE
jgi:hypothetical protein